MDNVVRLGEELGRRAQKASDEAREAKKREPSHSGQKMTTAELKRFSQDGTWVSYHDVITSDGFVLKVRRLPMNREMRKNYGRLIGVLQGFGLLKKKTEYLVAFHEHVQLYEICEAVSGESILLVKSSECSQVWDWGI
jgi:hypothetical protein